MGFFTRRNTAGAAASATLMRGQGRGSSMKYPALAGQYLGLLEVGEGRRITTVAQVRSGLDTVQLDPRMHPLLTYLGGGLRSSANIFYPEVEPDLDTLAGHGLIVDLEDPSHFPTSGYRMTAAGTGMICDPKTGEYTILGTDSPVTVPEPVFRAWCFTDPCASILQTCQFVAKVHPEFSLNQVAAAVKQHLPSLHRAGAVKIDAALPVPA